MTSREVFNVSFLSILSKYMLPGMICDLDISCENAWDEMEYECCPASGYGYVKCGDTEECVSFGKQKFL